MGSCKGIKYCKCIILKLFMFQSTSSLSKMRFPFQFTKYVFFWPLSASASLVLRHCDTSLSSGWPHQITYEQLYVSTDRLGLCSPIVLKWRRYSSEREREMRGPFLISFLFSSFLLLFSSSLRIFLKASAVWSTWDERTFGGQPDFNCR